MSEASPAPTAPSPEERGARARELAGMLTRRALIIGACAVLIPIAVFILVELQPKQYRAAVIIQPAPLIPPDVVVSSQVPSGWFVSPDASFVALLAKTSPVRIEAARQLDRPAAQLGSLSATAQKKTGWVTVTATAESSRAALNETNA